MHKRFNLLVSLFFITIITIQGQSFLNSPYSRFGLGQLNQSGFSQNRAMGGITSGYRNTNSINFLNPASYSAIDTLSFVFDVGFQGGWLKVESAAGKNTTNMAYLDHVAMMFPIKRWWSTCLGISPFSRTGYDLLGSTSDTSFNYVYTGNGGISQFFIGNSVRIGKHVALGFNFSYLFGPIERSTTVGLEKIPYGAITAFNYKAHLSNIFFDYGIQFFTTIKQKHTLVAGADFSNDTDLKCSYSTLVTRYQQFSGTDTIEYSGKQEGSVLFPRKWGIGFTYKYNNQLTLGFDYHTQDWSKVVFPAIFGQHEPMTTSALYRAGLEFVPVPSSAFKRAGYLERISYRVGGVYEKTNLSLNGKQIFSYGMSFGVGIPWRNERKLFTNTSFNLTYEYRMRGTLDNSLIKETYHMITLGLILHDFWFVKPKYE
jgi:hypothetical protein